MRNKNTPTLAFFAATLAACGGHTSVTNTQNAATPSNETKTIHYESPDGRVKIDKTPYTPAQIDQLRAQYRRTNLVQLPIDSQYNANVFRITDTSIADYQNKIFLAPLIYSYGTEDGGRLLATDNSDGTMSLSFNVVFLDGSTREIPRPEANGSVITIPDTFAVHDPAGLKNLLQSQYGANNGLSPLPGCPKQIHISAGDYSVDVTPSEFRTADYCKLNTPISISLRVPKEVGKDILDRRLPMNAVNITGTFETRVSYPTSNIRIQFDRARAYSDIQAELGVRTFYVDADARIAIKNAIQHQLMTVSIQGETTEYVNELIGKVSNEFFTPFTPDPSIPGASSCTGVVCLRFSMATLHASDTMDFTFASDSNEMTGQNILTRTTLKPTPREVIIGRFNCDQGQNTRSTGACDRLRSGGEAKKTGLTVVDGDKIKITPNALLMSQYVSSIIGPIHTDNPICLRYLCESGRRCEPLQAITCMEYVNQWTETTTYGVPTEQSTYQAGAAASANLGLFYDTLSIVFEYTDHTTHQAVSTECSLSMFDRVSDGQGLTLKLENVNGCTPFTHNSNERPMISLKSRKLDDQTFSVGTKIERWDRSFTSPEAIRVVTPEIDFEGTLGLQNLYIESDY